MILEEPAPDKQVEIKVVDRWSVVHDDQRYVKGDTVTVPETAAQEWEATGYVERL